MPIADFYTPLAFTELMARYANLLEGLLFWFRERCRIDTCLSLLLLCLYTLSQHVTLKGMVSTPKKFAGRQEKNYLGLFFDKKKSAGFVIVESNLE